MTARGFTLADLLAGIDGARVRGDAGVAVAEVRDLDGGAVAEDPSGNAVLLRASDA